MQRTEVLSFINKNAKAKGLISDDKEIIETENFKNDLAFDSLDVVEFSMDIEAEFQVNLPDNEMNGVGTVSQLIDVVMKAIEAKK